jgi:hypothetical protein
MGLITELIGQEFASKRQEKQLQIEALSHVMQSSMNPEKKSEYAKEALKKIGLKGQNHEMFANLLSKTAHADAKGQAKGKQGAASDKPMFPSQSEELEAKKRESEAENQKKIDLQEATFKQTQAHNKSLYESNRSFYQDQLKQVDNLPLPEEKKQERVMEISRALGELDRVYHGLPAAEPKQPTAATEDIKNIKGSAMKGQKDAFGNDTDPEGVYTKGKDGKFYPEAPAPKAEAPPKPEPLSQEVRDQRAYYKSTGMDDATAEKMALKERHHELATKEKGAEIRVINAAENVANNKPMPEGHYTPNGPSVANPTGNMTIDVGAWDYIATGHLPFTGFSGGGKGKANAREKMLARAGELLSDLGLSPADLPAVRGSVKADMGALSKVTSMGALIGQFETTLEKNMKVAADLSDKFKRGDVRAYNRVISAFKTGKGDPEALNLAAQLHGVAREWGKIMQGSVSASGVQVSEANAADEFFGKGMSNGQLQSFFQNVIMPDIKNRSEAIQDQKDHLVGNLRKVVQDVKGGGGAAHFSEGSDHWDIPADKVEAFKKAHPNAKAQ